MSHTYKLTYFNIEGAAEKVRLAFLLNGIQFEDHRVSQEEWKDIKPTTKYGQLPLLRIDGNETFAQSGAMLRYIGRLGDSHLYPSDPHRLLEIEEVIGICGDFERAWSPCFYINFRPELFGHTEKNPELCRSMREKFVAESLPLFLKWFTDKIEAHGGFMTGPEPTVADLYALPMLRNFTRGHIDYVDVHCLDSHPAVTGWIARMMALPQLAEWYAKK